MTVAGVFGLPHLSEDAVTAFADGVLSVAAAARARRHCAECVECAEAVRAQREAVLLLRTAGTPTMPADLLSRLAGVPMSTPLPPPRGGLPTVLGADGVLMFLAHDPRNAGPSNADLRHPDPGNADRMAAEQHRPPGAACALGPASQPVNQPAQRSSHRRVLLPVGILASAAAVVAAGAIGTNLSSLQRPVEHQPASVQLTQLTGNTGNSGAAGNQRSNPLGIPSATLTRSAFTRPAVVRPGRPSTAQPIGGALLPAHPVLATAPQSGSR